jgi:hypothetical protein
VYRVELNFCRGRGNTISRFEALKAIGSGLIGVTNKRAATLIIGGTTKKNSVVRMVKANGTGGIFIACLLDG